MINWIMRRRPRRKLFRLEHFVYRTAGLPVACRAIIAPPSSPFDRALARQYWRPSRLNQWLEPLGPALLAPPLLPAPPALSSGRKGPKNPQDATGRVASQF